MRQHPEYNTIYRFLPRILRLHDEFGPPFGPRYTGAKVGPNGQISYKGSVPSASATEPTPGYPVVPTAPAHPYACPVRMLKDEELLAQEEQTHDRLRMRLAVFESYGNDTAALQHQLRSCETRIAQIHDRQARAVQEDLDRGVEPPAAELTPPPPARMERVRPPVAASTQDDSDSAQPATAGGVTGGARPKMRRRKSREEFS